MYIPPQEPGPGQAPLRVLPPSSRASLILPALYSPTASKALTMFRSSPSVVAGFGWYRRRQKWQEYFIRAHGNHGPRHIFCRSRQWQSPHPCLWPLQTVSMESSMTSRGTPGNISSLLYPWRITITDGNCAQTTGACPPAAPNAGFSLPGQGI